MSEMCFRAGHDLRASLSSEQVAVIVELYNRMTTECNQDTCRIRSNEEVDDIVVFC